MLLLRIIKLSPNNIVVSDERKFINDAVINLIDRPLYVTCKRLDDKTDMYFNYGSNNELKLHYSLNGYQMTYGIISGRIYKVESSVLHYQPTDYFHFSNDVTSKIRTIRGKNNIIGFVKIVKFLLEGNN